MRDTAQPLLWAPCNIATEIPPPAFAPTWVTGVVQRHQFDKATFSVLACQTLSADDESHYLARAYPNSACTGRFI